MNSRRLIIRSFWTLPLAVSHSAYGSGSEREPDLVSLPIARTKNRAPPLYHYKAHAKHEPTRPDHIEVECTLQHPQRWDIGLDAERNRFSDERQRRNHTAQRHQHP